MLRSDTNAVASRMPTGAPGTASDNVLLPVFSIGPEWHNAQRPSLPPFLNGASTKNRRPRRCDSVSPGGSSGAGPPLANAGVPATRKTAATALELGDELKLHRRRRHCALRVADDRAKRLLLERRVAQIGHEHVVERRRVQRGGNGAQDDDRSPRRIVLQRHVVGSASSMRTVACFVIRVTPVAPSSNPSWRKRGSFGFAKARLTSVGRERACRSRGNDRWAHVRPLPPNVSSSKSRCPSGRRATRQRAPDRRSGSGRQSNDTPVSCSFVTPVGSPSRRPAALRRSGGGCHRQSMRGAGAYVPPPSDPDLSRSAESWRRHGRRPSAAGSRP